MLPKEHRLKRDSDFQKLFKEGKSTSGSLFYLKQARNKKKHSRLAVVVGVKVSKSAVKRNRLRRQAQEVLRLNIEKIKPGADVAIVAKKEALGAKYEQIERDVLGLLKRAKLI